MSLSLKATQEDPWQAFARVHHVMQVVPGRVTKLVPFGAFVRVGDGIEGLVHISELAERHVEIPEQVVNVGDELFVRIIDVDLERRRISLSLKQANENVPLTVEDFDPTLYGMEAHYDEAGNYIYPEGYDAESQTWLPGHEEAQAKWEADYAKAQKHFESHMTQVTAAKVADAEAAEAGEGATSYSSDTAASGEDGDAGSEGSAPSASPGPSGTLASDEALQALKDKLGGES